MTPTVKGQYTGLAETISSITNPVLLVIVGLIFITNRYAPTSQDALNWGLLGSSLIVGPGLLYSIFTWYRERKVDIDITKRQDRVVPLLLASLGALIGGFLLEGHVQNRTLILLSQILVALLVSLTIITIVWKISLHVATFTAIATLIVIFRGWEFSLLYIFLLPVAWSRLYLKQHTPNQLIAGLLIGASLTFALAWAVHY
jgi:membrane-associated phospholipid phosphatase